ncbi:DUF6221 family protein [Streptomyces sp. 3214.6]|uniref:DUF6221 family protein n=1 Tax=Streptomyces sp. 3214.6 TaxID=1882757 RepID=UPI00090C9D8A|nr:DUF6221 family protein [Streptomyces sp. 3214.6]SHI67709.1 hypothetical protein SAMN05444521_8210 [Streptomyces sp. 3214.6]
MDDLVQWLRAQLDEDDRIARAAAEELEGLELGGEWWYDGQYVETVREHTMVAVGSQDFMDPATGRHIAEWDPARVLREIDAKRQLVCAYEEAVSAFNDSGPALTSYDRLTGSVSSLRRAIELLALPYADRPGYREEWRP